jgi:hypothetical protein
LRKRVKGSSGLPAQHEGVKQLRQLRVEDELAADHALLRIKSPLSTTILRPPSI